LTPRRARNAPVADLVQRRLIKSMGKNHPMVRILVVGWQVDGFIVTGHQHGILTRLEQLIKQSDQIVNI